MNFNEIYEKYKAGTATLEEEKYVLDELAKARNILELTAPKAIEFCAPDEEIYLKAKSKMKFKTILISLVVSFITMAIFLFGSFGLILGVATTNAKDNVNVTEAQAKEIAIEEIITREIGLNIVTSDLVLKDFDKDLNINLSFSNSFYEYEIKYIYYQGDSEIEFEVKIDSTNGEITEYK